MASYKGYTFTNKKRGFGSANVVETAAGKAFAFCQPTASDWQSSVRPAIQWPGNLEIGNKEDSAKADKMICLIESGEAREMGDVSGLFKLNDLN